MGKRGRRPLLVARVSTTADDAVWEELEHRYEDRRNAVQRRRVVTTFFEFCGLNGFPVASSALKKFVGSAINCGVKVGTVNTYVQYVAKAITQVVPASDLASVRNVVRLVALCHADAETRKAPDISFDFAVKIINALAGDAQLVVAAITFTGCRCRDIMRWLGCRCTFRTNSYAIDVRITKGRRTPDKRVTHRVADVKALLGEPLHPCLLKVKDFPTASRPFETWNALRVNRAIDLARKALQLTEESTLPRYTTYSFRRLYCQQVLRACDHDFEKAARYTLHCRAEVLCAFYDATK